jgi:hypothetical protein
MSQNKDTPFLQWLGEEEYSFRYYENQDREIAAVVPHTLLVNDLYLEQAITIY